MDDRIAAISVVIGRVKRRRIGLGRRDSSIILIEIAGTRFLYLRNERNESCAANVSQIEPKMARSVGESAWYLKIIMSEELCKHLPINRYVTFVFTL